MLVGAGSQILHRKAMYINIVTYWVLMQCYTTHLQHLFIHLLHHLHPGQGHAGFNYVFISILGTRTNL